MKTFEEYETAALSTAIYPGQGTVLGLMYVALKGAGEAGEFAEHVGKAIRDDELVTPYQDTDANGGTLDCALLNELTRPRRLALQKEVGDKLWYLAAQARELGTTLSAIAEQNIEKLQSRKERGVLGGSGDNR